MSTPRSHLHAHDALGIRSQNRRRGPGTSAEYAMVILRALKERGPLAEMMLLDAIREAGFTLNLNTFTVAVSWLRANRALKTKPAKPRGRKYWIEGQPDA